MNSFVNTLFKSILPSTSESTIDHLPYKKVKYPLSSIFHDFISSQSFGSVETIEFEQEDLINETSRLFQLDYGEYKKNESQPVSIFTFSKKAPGSENLLPLAMNCISKLKSLKHPRILSYLASHENEEHVALITERVVPISLFLMLVKSKLSTNDDTAAAAVAAIKDYILLGIYELFQAVLFLHGIGFGFPLFSNPKLALSEGIFVCLETGDWKLGGLQTTFSPSDYSQYEHNVFLYLSKESGGKKPFKDHHGWAGFKEVVKEIFDKVNHISIPKDLHSLLADVKSMSTSSLETNPLFAENSLLKTTLDIESIFLHSSSLVSLATTVQYQLSREYAKSFITKWYMNHKWTSKLIEAYLNSLLSKDPIWIGIILDLTKMNKIEFEFFKLKFFPWYVSLLDPKTSSGAMTPEIKHRLVVFARYMKPYLTSELYQERLYLLLSTTYIKDPHPLIRECALCCIVDYVDLTSKKSLNDELQKMLVLLSQDPYPNVREAVVYALDDVYDKKEIIPWTNETWQKVWLDILVKGLLDPVLNVKIASLKLLKKIYKLISAQSLANRLLPLLCPLLLLPSKQIDKNGVIKDVPWKEGEPPLFRELALYIKSYTADVLISCIGYMQDITVIPSLIPLGKEPIEFSKYRKMDAMVLQPSSRKDSDNSTPLTLSSSNLKVQNKTETENRTPNVPKWTSNGLSSSTHQAVKGITSSQGVSSHHTSPLILSHKGPVTFEKACTKKDPTTNSIHVNTTRVESKNGWDEDFVFDDSKDSPVSVKTRNSSSHHHHHQNQKMAVNKISRTTESQETILEDPWADF